MGILWVVGVVCAVWVIYDVFTQQKKMKTEMKVVWAVAAVMFSIITAVIYYFVVKNK